MKTVLLSEDRISEWNDLLQRESSFAMMQSWAWGEVKSRLGWRPYRIAVMEGARLLAGAQVLIKPLPFGVGSLAYIPRGPFGEWKNLETAKMLFDAVHEIARKHRAIFLKIEPGVENNQSEMRELFSSLGLRENPISNQPCATIVMDITPEPEVILHNMRDSTRRKIRTAEKKGVSVRLGSGDDLEIFYQLMQVTARRAGFSLRCFEYYQTEFGAFASQNQAALFLADYQGQVIAAHIAYAFGRHAAFFHQASNNEISALNPNCLLVWEEIKWAKAKGCVTYDLWGIPDEISSQVSEEPDSERTDGLWGVYRFKSGFSKNIRCYMGAFDYIYSPAIYLLLNNRLMNQSNLEKISTWMDRRSYRQMEKSYASR